MGPKIPHIKAPTLLCKPRGASPHGGGALSRNHSYQNPSEIFLLGTKSWQIEVPARRLTGLSILCCGGHLVVLNLSLCKFGFPLCVRMLGAHSSLLNAPTLASSLLRNHPHHLFHPKTLSHHNSKATSGPATWPRDREHLGGEMREGKSEGTRNKPGKSFTPILPPPRAEHCCSLPRSLFGPARVTHHPDPLLATPILYPLPGATALLSACPFGCSCLGIL